MASEGELRTLLRYFIDEVWRHERRPGRTRLMKLIYLLDAAHAATHQGVTWTGLRWRFHYYGPYAAELQTALDRMDGVDADDEARQGPAGRYHVYSGAHGAAEYTDLERLLGASDRVALKTIVDRWARADLDELLDYVYFETAPMKDARRGEVLDFAKAVKPFHRTMVRNPVLSEERLQQLRARLRERQISRGVPLSQVTRPLTDVEERLLARAEGVRAPLPEGVVELGRGREE